MIFFFFEISTYQQTTQQLQKTQFTSHDNQLGIKMRLDKVFKEVKVSCIPPIHYQKTISIQTEE